MSQDRLEPRYLGNLVTWDRLDRTAWTGPPGPRSHQASLCFTQVRQGHVPPSPPAWGSLTHARALTRTHRDGPTRRPPRGRRFSPCCPYVRERRTTPVLNGFDTNAPRAARSHVQDAILSPVK